MDMPLYCSHRPSASRWMCPRQYLLSSTQMPRSEISNRSMSLLLTICNEARPKTISSLRLSEAVKKEISRCSPFQPPRIMANGAYGWIFSSHFRSHVQVVWGMDNSIFGERYASLDEAIFVSQSNESPRPARLANKPASTRRYATRGPDARRDRVSVEQPTHDKRSAMNRRVARRFFRRFRDFCLAEVQARSIYRVNACRFFRYVRA